MKILYHHRTLGDGAEGIHVSAMIKVFRKLGHDVRVEAVIGEGPNRRAGALCQLKTRMPRTVYEIMELGYSFVGYRSLMRHNSTWKPDLIYERYSLFNIGSIAAARRTNVPLVLEVNAPLAYERKRYEHLVLQRVARVCERFVCSRARVVAVVSTPLKEYLVQQGVPPGHIFVLPNGTDPEVFRPDAQARQEIRTRFGIPRSAVVVGFVGILRPWHGIELLVQAMAQEEISRSCAHLLIVGDGPSRLSLDQLVRSQGLEARVTFTGRVPHSEIPRHIAAFDIGVSPRATFYASPMKIPEYMASGAAVLAPRMANIQDLINDGIDGILFEPEDVGAMASVLSGLIRDPERRAQLGKHARATILTRLTWQHNGEQILNYVGNGHA